MVRNQRRIGTASKCRQERKLFILCVVLVYNGQILATVGARVDSPRSSFVHIFSHHAYISLRWRMAGRGWSRLCGQHTAFVFSVGGGTVEPDCDKGK